MKRHEFEHAVRAAGSILATDKLLVIGSQAIHASTDRLFDEAERSIEVDVASLGKDADKAADLIDGSIGELSIFQETFGYYAQGVTPETAILPKGWRNRLVPFTSPSTNGVTAMCLEPHDLWLSKAAAGRSKDKEFCQTLIARGLVDPAILLVRLTDMPKLDVAVLEKIQAWISQGKKS